MYDTLTRDPLHVSLSMIQGHNVELPPAPDPRHQPLAYLYSLEWDGQLADPQPGHYDKDSQTWMLPPGVPSAGVNTNTSTSCYAGSDTCRDDVCF
ncbi:hypothetical protein SAMN04489712_10769 [Thermomonospora echinospora]|uniref:Uncharacterized protein n=1 Tax=Thermomonospora echinospora TaxID=1992 RepID=A0A1H6BGH5_9ACTN|nr:hypothetical protein [Thermomonospora echinospora]SEG59445.1 hypothetical protein SAMN04489712_10769 [Thermomonospora echinospora]